MHKKFVLSFFTVFLLLLFAISLPSYYLMKKFDEYTSVVNLVHKQDEHDAIYSSLLDHNAIPYKLALIAKKKPLVVAVGSSRAMQLRSEFFKENISFINAGGAAASVEDLNTFITEMLKTHHPESIIIVLDFWWFNPNRKSPIRSIEGTLENFNLLKAIHFLKLLITKGIPNVNNLINNRPLLHNISKLNVIGLSAAYDSSGYRNDGSRLYYDILFGDRLSPDINFEDSRSRIANGVRRFEYSEILDLQKVATLKNTIKILREKHVNTVVIIPPLSPEVNKYMSQSQFKKKYRFLEDFLILAENEMWLNYHNAEKIKSDNCEFIDGFHGGDVTYHRILLDMSKKIDWFNKYINQEKSRRLVSLNHGKAYTQTSKHKNLETFKEIDFLEIGCKK